MSQACASSNHGSWKHITVATTMTYAASTMQCRRCGESQCRIASHRVLLSVAATVAELMFPVSRCVRNTRDCCVTCEYLRGRARSHGGSVIFHVAERHWTYGHTTRQPCRPSLERGTCAAELLELFTHLHLHQRILERDGALFTSRAKSWSSVCMPSFSPDCQHGTNLMRLATADQ